MIRMADPLPTTECPSLQRGRRAQYDVRIENESGDRIEQLQPSSNRVRRAGSQRETVRSTSWHRLYGIDERGYESTEVDR